MNLYRFVLVSDATRWITKREVQGYSYDLALRQALAELKDLRPTDEFRCVGVYCRHIDGTPRIAPVKGRAL